MRSRKKQSGAKGTNERLRNREKSLRNVDNVIERNKRNEMPGTFNDPKPIFGQDPFLHTLPSGARLLIQSEDDKRIVVSDWDRPETNDPKIRVTVWDSPDEQELWAPEMHRIGPLYFILYSFSDGDNRNHRNHILIGTNPLGPFTRRPITDQTQWGIDCTFFQYDDKQYLAWSGWPHPFAEFPQNLYIAPFDKPEERTLLLSPALDWEGEILEGPQWCNNEIGTGITYSANKSWTTDYATGFLEFYGGDPLNPNNWSRDAKPLALNKGHAQALDDETDLFIYHKKLSPFPGWADRVIEVGPIPLPRYGV